jgi:hypothetical protein
VLKLLVPLSIKKNAVTSSKYEVSELVLAQRGPKSPALSLLSFLSPEKKRAKRDPHRFPAAGLVAPLSRGPLARRRGLSFRIHRAELYSCSLGLGYVARCEPAISLSPMEMVAAFNKSAPDVASARRFPVLLVADMRARSPGGVGVAAVATSARFLSSNSADVVAFAPTPPRSSGGTI